MTENNTVLQPMRTSGLTGYHLKLIALITMLVDHIAAVLIWRIYVASYQITGSMQLSDFIGDKIIVWVASNQELVYTIYEWMRYIGRMAFPIYCFLLVEGFLHTRSAGKYAVRLAMFAVLSEIPFDLAITGEWWSLDYSNVFFTLLIGLLLIWGLSYIEKLYEFWQEKQWDPFGGKLLIFLLGAFTAVAFGSFAEIVLKSDYGMGGVLAIALIYLLRRTKEVAYVLSVFVLMMFCGDIELLALFMLFPIVMYDGTRGKNIKYVFYAFYPVHLFLLAGICMIFHV